MNSYFVNLVIYIALSFLLASRALAASASRLDTFAHNVVAELNRPQFEAKWFCEGFWLLSQRSTCSAIPWTYVVENGVNLSRVIEVEKGLTGFVLVEMNDKMNQLFTISSNGNKYFLSLDHLPVWKSYTKNWNGTSSLKFATYVSKSLAEDIESDIKAFHDKIRSQFKLSKTLQLPFYFVSSRDSAQELGLAWDEFKLGGGARDGFILIIGDIQKNLRSTLLHELVHSYTVYPGEFWKGPGVFSNALLSEGLATWIQTPEAWKDEVPKNMLAQSLCKDITIVRQKLNSNFFELLDNSQFRAFDGQNGSFKSGYVAGAALTASILQQMSPNVFQKTWNEIGRQTDPQVIQKMLLKKMNENRLFQGMQEYLNWFEAEIENQSSLKCSHALIETN